MTWFLIFTAIILLLMLIHVIDMYIKAKNDKPKPPIHNGVTQKSYMISQHFKEAYRNINLAEYEMKRIINKVPDDSLNKHISMDIINIGILKDNLKRMRLSWEYISSLPKETEEPNQRVPKGRFLQ